jgi:hypothetical protein
LLSTMLTLGYCRLIALVLPGSSCHVTSQNRCRLL